MRTDGFALAAQLVRVIEIQFIDLVLQPAVAGNELPVGGRGDDKSPGHRKIRLRQAGETGAFTA